MRATPLNAKRRYSNLTVATSAVDGGKKCTATASVTVTNSGSTASREVVQLYLHRPSADVALGDVASEAAPAPVTAPWALKGYQRTEMLVAGATATVVFTLTPHDLSTVSVNGSRNIPPGSYIVKVGGGNPRDPHVQPPPVAATLTVAPGCVY
jgi:beta-glucosidase